MNTALRNAATAALLGTVLVMAGCATKTAHNGAAQPATEFAVVDTSKGLVLTPQQMAELQKSVAEFLQGQGHQLDGQYFVKVNFTPDKPEADGQWAVVRISLVPSRTYTVLAAYPGPDDYYPYDAYGYYPSFAGYSYYDPFDYNYGYYHPPYPVAPPYHKPDHGPGGGSNSKPGDKPDHPTGAPPTTGWYGNHPAAPGPYLGNYGNQPRNSGNQPPNSSSQPHNTGAQPHAGDYFRPNSAPSNMGSRNVETKAFAPTIHQTGSPHVFTPSVERQSTSSSSTPAAKDGTTVKPGDK